MEGEVETMETGRLSVHGVLSTVAVGSRHSAASGGMDLDGTLAAEDSGLFGAPTSSNASHIGGGETSKRSRM